MGVKGLWSLLNPVARPVKIETMEGKRLAIDSSIWLYQFQATMRDKDGRGLVNAHILGFLRRINRLLFHGIKPVFVFDGGAPNLKRQTIAERKRKKSGAALNHTVVAKKLLAAQMRREAVKATKEAQERRAAKTASGNVDDAGDAEEEGDVIDENAVYLEDLEGQSRPRLDPSEARPTLARNESSTKSHQSDRERELSPASRRKSFRNHDPYKLPDLPDGPLTRQNQKAGAQPDHRLATEEEMKYFINEAQLDDLDFESAEFRALPAEVQYEFVGDMRVRSRQPNSQRLAKMLQTSTSAMDFSKAQIKGLSQRNVLTQQLLTVTDTIGKANITIPIRVAAERNREYVLVKKSEAEGGGWALGIREQGTKAKPIKIDESPKKEVRSASKPRILRDGYLRRADKRSDDEDDEGYEMLESGPVDEDLREHRRQEMISAIAQRYAPKVPAKPSLDLPVKAFGKTRAPGSKPLFDSVLAQTAHDGDLAAELQNEEHGEAIEDAQLAKALEDSREEYERQRQISTPHIGSDGESLEEVVVAPSTHVTPLESPIEIDTLPFDRVEHTEEDDFEEVAVPRSAPKSPDIIDLAASSDEESDFSMQSAEAGPGPSTLAARQAVNLAERQEMSRVRTLTPEEGDSEMSAQREMSRVRSASLEVELVEARPTRVVKHNGRVAARSEAVSKPAVPLVAKSRGAAPDHDIAAIAEFQAGQRASHAAKAQSFLDGRAEDEKRAQQQKVQEARQALEAFLPSSNVAASPQPMEASDPNQNARPVVPTSLAPTISSRSPYPEPATERPDMSRQTSLGDGNYSVYDSDQEDHTKGDDQEHSGEDEIGWSKSPSPVPRERTRNGDAPLVQAPLAEDDGGIDMIAEEDDYARFVAQIQHRDLDKVREEIDDEVRVLHAQQKVALRDSEEITQAMILQTQELLRYYGIPYVTAPMEAEAQCAKLAELNLVDGIITDDSDVFLFGGKQCYKNVFNDAKYAECFLLSDLDREMSLTRERLITLAYLLGSDYTLGLPGVGPVVAMELMANFPGPSGLDDFKVWWMKVQMGKDSEEDTSTKWRKSFKKRFETVIFLTADWPNILVRDAYKYPDVDASEEPFNWGFPDLTALRSFLSRELSWSITKIDHEMSPIMQRLAQRGTGSLTKQSRLDPFFDMSAGQGAYIPRQRTTANVSKRLLAVIKQYCEAEARLKGEEPAGWGVMMADLDESDPKGRGTGQPKPKRSASTASDGSRKRKKTPGSVGADDPNESEDSDEAPMVKRKATPKARGQASGRARARAAMTRPAKKVGETSAASADSMRVGQGRGRGGRGRGRGRGGKAASAIEVNSD